jgi:hypothetical protein
MSREDLDASIANLLGTPIDLQPLERTPSDDEIDSLLGQTYLYASKYAHD